MRDEVLARIMKRCKQRSLLLWLTAVVLIKALEIKAAQAGNLVTTNTSVQVIPRSDNFSVTKLVIEGNLITLNEEDRLALASYPKLEELHLDGNLVTSIPANYFSVVPKLRVLSLSRNSISSLDLDSFFGLDVLTELDLSYNLLTSIHTELFRHIYKIQLLSLQGNPWNCSCPLLSSMVELKAAGGPNVTCASLESQDGRDFLQATALCDPMTTTTVSNGQSKVMTTLSFQQSSTSFSVLNATVMSQIHTTKDQTPLNSNTWKFTVCVLALALCTFMVIICGIKGPSWFKLFYDYHHHRLRQEEAEDVVSAVFTSTGRAHTHHTFTFEQQNGQIEEDGDADAYFEDPYIKREGEEA